MKAPRSAAEFRLPPRAGASPGGRKRFLYSVESDFGTQEILDQWVPVLRVRRPYGPRSFRRRARTGSHASIPTATGKRTLNFAKFPNFPDYVARKVRLVKFHTLFDA